MAVLTYNYADSVAVIGPLPAERDPHGYDLCLAHARSLTVPNGWTVQRVPGELRQQDDVLALAKALADAEDRPSAASRAPHGAHRAPAAPAQAPHREGTPAQQAGAAGQGRHLRVCLLYTSDAADDIALV